MPDRPFCKSRLHEDKAFGNGEGKMKNVTRRKAELGLTAFEHNVEF